MGEITGLLKDFPNCQNCETFECLHQPWVLAVDIEDFILAWREEINIIKDLEREPSPIEQVKFLQVIKTEEMTDFFRRFCLA